MIWWDQKYPDLVRLTQSGANAMPDHLGIAFVAVGTDWISAHMPVDHRTHQPFGRLHGGASVALAETVGSMAGAMVVDPERYVVVGMEINANHIRPAFDGYVVATATAESLGRTTQIWTIRITNEEGKLVCLSRFTAAVILIDRK